MSDHGFPLEDGDRWTPKGNAFLHYFFQARGGEEDLTNEKALDDFEKYIAGPMKVHVLREFVIDMAEGALEETCPEGPDELTDEKYDEAERLVGEAVMYLAGEFLKAEGESE